MAHVVGEHGEQYAPILDRLRRELVAMRSGESQQQRSVSQLVAPLPDISDIAEDTPLRPETAARLAFPDGIVSGRALRAAASRGDLEHERLAGRIVVTLRWVREWRERNRHPVRPRSEMGQPSISAERRAAALTNATQIVKEMLKPKKPRG